MSTLSRVTLVTVSSAFVGLGAWVAACGGGDDNSANIPAVDSGVDSGGSPGTSGSSGGTSGQPGPDTGAPPPADAGCVEGAACTTDQGGAGLCHSGGCASCADTTDDSACSTAYGAAFDGGSAICNAGACVPGNCHTNANCTGSQLCGVKSANLCSPCTTDSQCNTAYGPDYVCNTQTGGCETNATACNVSSDAGVCLGNPADICCVESGGAAGTCQPGNCCSSTQCPVATPFCVNRTCTSCVAPPASGPYYVDPAVTTEQDGVATGSVVPVATCAFRSITHALAVIGNNAAPNTLVYVKGNVGANETFPIIVPKNVTVRTDPTVAADIHVAVTAGSVGFILASPSSGLAHLAIDGQSKTATTGIVAQSGSASTTSLDHVSVSAFSGSGIEVRDASGSTVGGALAVGPGVTSTANGAVGLQVMGHGTATVTVPAGQDAAHFDSNDIGIRVADSGQLTLTGDVGATAPTTGTVTTTGNASAGTAIDQIPGAGVRPNAVTGLTSWNTSAGAGLRIHAGSSVKLRASSLLHNSTAGVHVFSFVDGATVVDDVSKIDLGSNAAEQAGKNALQAPSPNANTNAGICLQITKNVGQILMAYGNTLVTKATPVTSVDCSTTAGVVSLSNTQCVGAVSVGIVGPANNTNQVITLSCTQ